MADTATTPTGSDHLPGNNGNALGLTVDFDILLLLRTPLDRELPLLFHDRVIWRRLE
jgi:hypothetical protein